MGQTTTSTTVSGTGAMTGAAGQTDIHVRVDAQVKAETERILGKIGISMSDLINMTLRRVIAERRIPFDTTIENEDEMSLEEYARKVGVPPSLIVNSREELMEKLEEAFERAEKYPEERYTSAQIRERFGLRVR